MASTFRPVLLFAAALSVVLAAGAKSPAQNPYYTPIINLPPSPIAVVPGSPPQVGAISTWYLTGPSQFPQFLSPQFSVASAGAPVSGLTVVLIPGASWPYWPSLSVSALAGTVAGQYPYTLSAVYNQTIGATYFGTVTVPFNVYVTGASGEFAVPTATPTVGPAPLTVDFAATNIAGPSAVLTWNFGEPGAATVTGIVASHTYTTPGNYSPTLTIAPATGPAFTIDAPVVHVAGPTVVDGVAPHDSNRPGGTDSIFVKLGGSSFSPNSTVTFGGAPATVLANSTSTLLNLSVNTFGIPNGPVDIVVSGSNGTVTIPNGFVHVPATVSVASGPVVVGQPLPITVMAWPIDTTSVIYVDGVAMATQFVPGPGGPNSSPNLTAVVPASMTTDRSSLIIQVGDAATAGRVSRAKVLPLGAYSNYGTISFSPMNAAPGDALDLRLQELQPSQGITWVFAVNPTRVFPFGSNFVLDVDSPTIIPIFDGLGLFSGVLPLFADAAGEAERTVVLPGPTIGVFGRMQAVVGLPVAPGWRLTWSCPISF